MLTPEEELELQKLQEEQSGLLNEQQTLTSDFEALQKEFKLSKRKPVSTGYLESFARGIAQEGLLERADEATAKLKSTAFGTPYEEELEQEREEYKAAEEQYPITNIAGRLTGGIAQGIGLTALTGGAAAPVAVGRVAKTASLLPRAAKAILSPSYGGAIKNIATGITTGAAAGALMESGRSEKEGLEAWEKAPSAALSGAVVGGAFSGVLEGVKGVAGYLKGKFADKVKAKQLPAPARIILQAGEAGKEGKGLTSEESKERIRQEAIKVSEEVPAALTNTLNELENIKSTIIQNTEGVVDLSIPVENALTNLKKLGSQDANSIASDIQNKYNILKNTGNITVAQAYNFAKEIKNAVYSKRELPNEIKNIVYDTNTLIQNLVKARISPEISAKTITSDPDILKSYLKYMSSVDEQDLLDTISAKAPEIRDPQIALQKANELKESLKITSDILEEENINILDLIQNEDIKDIYDQLLYAFNPITTLNEKQNKLLEASKILGNVTNAKGEAEIVDDIAKIFNTLIRKSKDGASSDLTKEKFDRVVKLLNEVDPKLVDKIKKNMDPVVRDMESARFIEGSTFEQPSRGGALGEDYVGGIVSRKAAQAANLLAQINRAARKGESGPVTFLPSTVLLKPEVAVLKGIKTKLEKDLFLKPESIAYKSFIKGLDEAINQQDEIRRAAILKTLMTYAPFREFLKRAYGNSEEK